MKQKMFEKDDQKIFGSVGEILEGTSSILDSLGKGISSSISAANNTSSTVTTNENHAWSFTDSRSIAIIAAVAAVVIVALVVFFKKR